MLIKNRDNISKHLRDIWKRADLTRMDKIVGTNLLLEEYENFEFSIKDYAGHLKISTSTLKRSIDHLDRSRILERKKKIPLNRGIRYRYIFDCNKI
ncbi:hypothetical protein [Psychrilyobacter sp.]|uniref:hypothetical protein n=1 Tax=Psychrilyobacter sp. TaxID=2586924 RepID=UPI003019D7E0